MVKSQRAYSKKFAHFPRCLETRPCCIVIVFRHQLYRLGKKITTVKSHFFSSMFAGIYPRSPGFNKTAFQKI